MKSRNNELSDIEKNLESPEEDARWAGAIEAGELVLDEPHRAWEIVVKYGSSDDLDLRDAIATCVLEHLLENHFNIYFPKVEELIKRGNPILGSQISFIHATKSSHCSEFSGNFDWPIFQHIRKVMPRFMFPRLISSSTLGK